MPAETKGADTVDTTLFADIRSAVNRYIESKDIPGLVQFGKTIPTMIDGDDTGTWKVAYDYTRTAYLFLTRPDMFCTQTPAQTAFVAPTVKKSEPMPRGFYTIEFEDGSYVTLRISDDFRENAHPDSRMAGYLSGASNTTDYTGFAFIDGMRNIRTWSKFRDKLPRQHEALRVLLGAEDTTEYGKAYARQSGNCYVCGRVLTTPESIEAGIGPVCAGKQ